MRRLLRGEGMVQCRLKPIDDCCFNSFLVAPDHVAPVFSHVSAGTVVAPSWAARSLSARHTCGRSSWSSEAWRSTSRLASVQFAQECTLSKDGDHPTTCYTRLPFAGGHHRQVASPHPIARPMKRKTRSEHISGSQSADGGETGIRTLETVSRLHAFQACAFDHSATSPANAP